MTPFICIKEGRIMNFEGHLEKFGGQNLRNSKKQGGHGKPCKNNNKTQCWRKKIRYSCDLS